jgi:hypothetical protein
MKPALAAIACDEAAAVSRTANRRVRNDMATLQRMTMKPL